MTIVLDMGTWHIEVHEVPVDLVDGAGQIISSTVNINRPGPIISVASSGSNAVGANDNANAIGYVAIVDGTNAEIDIGDSPTSIRIRLNKTVGSSGAVTVSYKVQLIIRDSR